MENEQTPTGRQSLELLRGSVMAEAKRQHV